MAVVVGYLVERLLLTPEIRGLIPNIGKVLPSNCKLNRKDKNKKRPLTRDALLEYHGDCDVKVIELEVE